MKVLYFWKTRRTSTHFAIHIENKLDAKSAWFSCRDSKFFYRMRCNLSKYIFRFYLQNLWGFPVCRTLQHIRVRNHVFKFGAWNHIPIRTYPNSQSNLPNRTEPNRLERTQIVSIEPNRLERTRNVSNQPEPARTNQNRIEPARTNQNRLEPTRILTTGLRLAIFPISSRDRDFLLRNSRIRIEKRKNCLIGSGDDKICSVYIHYGRLLLWLS